MTYSGVQIVNLGTPWEYQPALHPWYNWTTSWLGAYFSAWQKPIKTADVTRRGRCTVLHETFRDTCMKATTLEVEQLSHYSGPVPGFRRTTMCEVD